MLMERVVILLLLVYTEVNNGLNMLPFGPDEGDTFTSKQDDACSQEQMLSKPLSFYGVEYQSLYVCMNGLVSFGAPETSYTPDSFPIENITLIAPLWVDIDVRDPLIDFGDFSDYNGTVYDFDAEDILNDASNIYLTDETRDAIEQYGQSDLITEQRLHSDDEISAKIFNQHDVDRKLKVNLANNVFKREVTADATLQYLGSILQGRLKQEASVDWAYIVTWYNVGTYNKLVDAFNSFQLVLLTANVESGNQSTTFIIFIYDRIHRTFGGTASESHAQAGFNDGKGNYYMLPGSQTPEVRNLVLSSNVGDPGTWIFKLDEDGGVACNSGDVRITPILVDQYGGTEFSISGYCEIPMNATLQLELTGRGRMRLIEATATQEGTIIGNYPYWGKSETVRARVVIDSIGQFQFMDITYTDCENKIGGSCHTVLVEDACESGRNLNINWDTDAFSDDPNGITIVVWEGIFNNSIPGAGDRLPSLVLSSTAVQASENNGHSRLSLTTDPDYVQVSVTTKCQDTDSCKQFEKGLSVSKGDMFVSEPKVKCQDQIPGSDTVECIAWIERERHRGKNWHDEIAKWYGCPKYDERFGEGLTDRWFAEQEIAFGFRGWVNESNCGPVSEEFCDLFCIRSPQMLVQDNLGETFEASNRCCYSSSGNLITDISKGAGRAHRTALYLSKETVEDDIKSFRYCCASVESCQNALCEDICTEYYEYRPVIVGTYMSSLVRILMGDPHFHTFDGLRYTFNGLGVYTLVYSAENDSEIQASTRVFGRGTVFSGVAIRDSSILLSMFQKEDGDVQLEINGNRIQLGELYRYSVDGVSIQETADSTTLTFIFPTEVSVKVLLREDVMNIGVSIPSSWQGKVVGLMGNFDGDPTNDLASSDGGVWRVELVESPETMGMTQAEALGILHDGFGESWRVNSTNWLFGAETRYHLQQEFESNFEAEYTVSFTTEEDRRRAEQACAAAEHYELCLLDVSLTNDTRFASIAQGLEKEIQVTEILFQGYQEPPNKLGGTLGKLGGTVIALLIVLGIVALITILIGAISSSKVFCK